MTLRERFAVSKISLLETTFVFWKIESRWKKINIQIDRATFCKALDQVRRIRNDVMHFDPDGIPPADLERLRDFAGFMQKLQTMGVS